MKPSKAVAPIAGAVHDAVATPQADALDCVIRVGSPYVIMYNNGDGQVTCRIHPPSGYTYMHYGMLVCDLVRHIAHAFEVNEEAVWNSVERERRNPTTDITRPS